MRRASRSECTYEARASLKKKPVSRVGATRTANFRRVDVGQIIAAHAFKPFILPAAPHERLTEKQREVFELLLQGWNTRQIGHRLSRSPQNVSISKRLLFARLGVSSLVELGAYAEKRGLMRVHP